MTAWGCRPVSPAEDRSEQESHQGRPSSQGDGPGGERRSRRRRPADTGGGKTTATGHTGIVKQRLPAASPTQGQRPQRTWRMSRTCAGRGSFRTGPLSLDVKPPGSSAEVPETLAAAFSTDGVHGHICVAACFATTRTCTHTHVCTRTHTCTHARTHKTLEETAFYVKNNSRLHFLSLTVPKPAVSISQGPRHPPGSHGADGPAAECQPQSARGEFSRFAFQDTGTHLRK